MYIGQPLPRDEDERLLKGRGRYAGDIELPGMVNAAFLRSPHAHANIKSLSVRRAKSMPGVLDVITSQDWRVEGFGECPLMWDVHSSDGRSMNAAMRPVFVNNKVCHVGDTIAAVIAETETQAYDALEAIDIDYEALPCIHGTAHALDPDVTILHERFDTNIITDSEHGDYEETMRAFSNAHHVTELILNNNRITGVPLEPRIYIGYYDDTREHYTLWGSIQLLHWMRNAVARCLNLPYHKLRVIGPDIGGGFGTKGFFYPEAPAVLYAAKRIDRPVRWTSTRSEAFSTDCHARDHFTKARMAFDADGHILGLAVETIASNGAYQGNYSAGVSTLYYPPTITGLYKTPAAHVKVTTVYTNGTTVDAYRGTGRPEATFVNERLIENGARELGIDVAEIRLRNYLQKKDYPYTNPLGRWYDCGDPLGQHEKLMNLANYNALKLETIKFQQKNMRMGLGMAGFAETSGVGPTRDGAGKGFLEGTAESAKIRIHQDGKVTLFSGCFPCGQGQYTTFRQVASDYLGLNMDDIDIIQNDTDLIPVGNGTWGARSLVTGGMAIVVACERIMKKMTKLAAHILECGEEDIYYRDSSFIVKGTDRKITFPEVAEIAYLGGDYPDEEFELGLEETVVYDPEAMTTPTAIHLAVVLVDTETGKVKLRNLYSVDDCGRIVNPLIVEGQVHGGMAQGFGQAMCEHIIYDSKSGQLLTGSFMDYGMPRAQDMPAFETDFQVTINPYNALGAKGCSETGAIGPPAAIGNAIVDALWDLGVRHIDMPYTPNKVWEAIQEACAFPHVSEKM